jgi:hypothetical protein
MSSTAPAAERIGRRRRRWGSSPPQFVVIIDTSIIGAAFAVQSGTTAYPAVPH